MSTTAPTSDPGESDRYVFVERPRCPSCGSENLYLKKTHPREADGSVTRDTRCKDCQWDFFIVEE